MMALKSVPLLMFALLCTWAPGIAQSFVPHVCPHTPAELQPVTERGRYIEEFDQAGWHATDAAFGRAPSPPPSVRMYVATKSSGRWTVYFGRMNDAKTAFIPAIVAVQQNASATFTAAPASDSSSIPSGLTGFALGIDSARSLFRSGKPAVQYRPVSARRFIILRVSVSRADQSGHLPDWGR